MRITVLFHILIQLMRCLIQYIWVKFSY